jgi:hypothetical protein
MMMNRKKGKRNARGDQEEESRNIDTDTNSASVTQQPPPSSLIHHEKRKQPRKLASIAGHDVNVDDVAAAGTYRR